MASQGRDIGVTWRPLNGRCKCGHRIDEDHTAEIDMVEERDERVTLITTEKRDKDGRKTVRAVKLERIKHFKVKIVCDFCKSRCKDMQQVMSVSDGEDTGIGMA